MCRRTEESGARSRSAGRVQLSLQAGGGGGMLMAGSVLQAHLPRVQHLRGEAPHLAGLAASGSCLPAPALQQACWASRAGLGQPRLTVSFPPGCTCGHAPGKGCAAGQSAEVGQQSRPDACVLAATPSEPEMQPVAVELLGRPGGPGTPLQGGDMALLHRQALLNQHARQPAPTAQQA